MNKDRIEIDLSKGRVWTGRNFEADLKAQILKDSADDIRQSEKLNAVEWPEDFGGRAFNIDLTFEELYDKMHNDPDYLSKYKLAVDMCISWEAAEQLFEFHLAQKQKVQDKVSRYHNSGRSRWRQHPEKPMQFRMNEPGKQRDYDNPHKSRNKKGWRRRAAEAMEFQIKREKYTDKERSDAINNADLDRKYY